MTEAIHIKYLVTSPEDKARGLIINSVGMQVIAPGEHYPPMKHPVRYHFEPSAGRVLEEYQLLYLTGGKGVFKTREYGPVEIQEGDMFLLYPGQWHSYHPTPQTGWTEMWIGFDGKIMDDWLEAGLLNPKNNIYHVGMHDSIMNMYRNAMKFADLQESGYQQILCGTVCHLVSLAIYLDTNHGYRQEHVLDIISKIRNYIDANISVATPESAAETVSMSYSKIRKLFKEYTGLTLGQYISEVKTNKAKNLLTNTPMTISEIAYSLGVENTEYFSTFFKRMTGIKPSQYRERQ